MASHRIIVVGAGIAGLAAAQRLTGRGCQVTVLERADRVGGRASSDQRDGFCFDAGAHQVWASDRNLLGLIASAGLEERLLPLRPFRLAQLYEGEARPVDPVSVLGVARIPGVRLHEALRVRRLTRIVRRFGDLLDLCRPEDASRLDDRSIADFSRLYFGRSVLERWVAPFCADASLCDPHSASRVLFLLRYVARCHAPSGSLRSGVGRLAQALASAEATRLGSVARSLEAKVGRIVVHHTTEGGDASLEADAVVLAVPAPVAREVADSLLRTPEREFLMRSRYAAAIAVSVALDRSVVGCATRTRIPAEEGWPAAMIAVEPGGPGTPAPEGKERAVVVAHDTWSRAHLEAPDDLVEKELLGLLQRLHPGAGSAACFTSTRRHRRAFPRFDVGRYREIAQFRRIQRDLRGAGRQLYFAGDYLVDPSLEGAVTSGLRAADQVLADLGVAKS